MGIAEVTAAFAICAEVSLGTGTSLIRELVDKLLEHDGFETTVFTLFLAALCSESILVEYVEVFDTKESMGMKLSNNLAVIGFGSSGKGIISVTQRLRELFGRATLLLA